MTLSLTLAASPYKGLVPFGESDLDALFFFGREREVEVVAANLLASRLTVLYGPTGVGKTSVLRAGVARSLRTVPFRRAVVVFDSWADEPQRRLAEAVAREVGIEPRASLAETLVDAGTALDGELYLVLDQLEEYFVYHGDTLAPGSFTAHLADALTQRGPPVNVLLCLREDALAKLDVLKTRVPTLFSNYLRLDHLDREAALSAILGPVERWNELFGGEVPMSVEAPLVETVLDQVQTGKVAPERSGRGTAGGERRARIEAPYLQLVLERIWEMERAQASATLRLATLTALGGASTIVGDHLTRALRQLSADEKAVAASSFAYLVTPSGTKVAHTARDLARYAGIGETKVRAVAERLVAERILRPVRSTGGGEDRFEIFHDVLAAAVLDWGTRFDAQREEARARQAAEARHRRATVVAAVSLIALIVVGAVAVYALTQRAQARDHARVARANTLAARALLLQSSEPGRALDRALEATRLAPSAQTETVLRSSLMASRLRRAIPTGSPVRAIAWAGPGRVAIGGADGVVRVWRTDGERVESSLETGGPIARLAWVPSRRALLVVGRTVHLWDPARGKSVLAIRSGTAVADAAVSDDGRLLAIAVAHTIQIRLVRDGKMMRRITTDDAQRVAFSPDGATVVAVEKAPDGRVSPITYDVASGRVLARLRQRGTTEVALSPAGDVLATGSADGTVALWRPRSGVLLRTLDDGGTRIRDLAFNPDGTMLATASSDDGVRVWRVADGSRFFLFLGHTAPVEQVTFAPDGNYLASTSEDGTARAWAVGDVDAGRPAAVLAGNDGSVTAAAFSPGGHSLVTGDGGGAARLWEPRIEQQLIPVARERTQVRAIRLSADGAATVAVTGRRVSIRVGRSARSFALRSAVFALAGRRAIATAVGPSIVVQSLPTGNRVAAFEGPATVAALAFRADGRELVAAGGRTVDVWRISTGELVGRFRAERAIVRVALAPDGRVVLTGDRSGAARLWSVGGKQLHVLQHHHGAVTSARFDASGVRALTTSEDSSDNAAVWDVATGRLLHGLVGHSGTVTAGAFSADGRWIVTAGPRSAAVWEAENGRMLFLLRGATDLLTDAEWAPRGYRIATAERDGIVREYRCVLCSPLAGLQALAERRIDAARRGEAARAAPHIGG